MEKYTRPEFNVRWFNIEKILTGSAATAKTWEEWKAANPDANIREFKHTQLLEITAYEF